MDNAVISFRQISVDDIPKLVRWEADNEVAGWWNTVGDSEDTIRLKWFARASAVGDPTHRNIINIDGEDIGEIQHYALADYPDDARERGIENAAGVDLFIGESDWRDRGVGTRVLSDYLSRIVFRQPGIKTCTIDPHPDNHRAIRCYEKVGFRFVKRYFCSVNKQEVYLMRIEPSESVDYGAAGHHETLASALPAAGEQEEFLSCARRTE